MRNSSLVPVEVLCTLIALSGSGCRESKATQFIAGSDPNRGAAAIGRYGCGSCHTIPRIPGAHGLVGPPLAGFGIRVYVAGMLSNEPANLVRWIRNPRAINQKTAMPDVGVTSQDANDIAAFLYSLR